MKYLVIYEKTATGYNAYPPDLPGCGAAGKTLDETKRLIHDAIEMHVAGLREDGETIPDPTTLADYVTA